MSLLCSLSFRVKSMLLSLASCDLSLVHYLLTSCHSMSFTFYVSNKSKNTVSSCTHYSAYFPSFAFLAFLVFLWILNLSAALLYSKYLLIVQRPSSSNNSFLIIPHNVGLKPPFLCFPSILLYLLQYTESIFLWVYLSYWVTITLEIRGWALFNLYIPCSS